ncbi:kinase-like domain-containing protein [Trametes maxima]|nr:kinase-like domain-containing protein [Trametes maxima]
MSAHPLPVDPLPPPEIEYIANETSDDDRIVHLTLLRHFPLQPLITSRLCHVLLLENADVPDAQENKIVSWVVNYYDDEADLEAYRTTLYQFADEYITPLLLSLPDDDVLLAPRDSVFVVRTIDDGNGHRTVHLTPGLPDGLREVETDTLRRLKAIGTMRPESIPVITPIYDADSIMVLSLFDSGSRNVMRVLLPDSNRSIAVMQWIPTVTMLLSPESTQVMEAGTLREMAVLQAIPPHPHVVGPPIAYVSRRFEDTTLLCGFVSRFIPGGTVHDVVLNAGQPVALARRAKWAYQLASALRHIHEVARTYHGDVKLDNVMLDEHDNAVLIDFEQGRANEEAAAPEIHAGATVSMTGDGMLVYRFPSEDEKPESCLGRRAYPYDAWAGMPRAIEAAEVHALGVAFSKLFEEDGVTSDIVKKCKLENPNARPTFEELEMYSKRLVVSLAPSC